MSRSGRLLRKRTIPSASKKSTVNKLRGANRKVNRETSAILRSKDTGSVAKTTPGIANRRDSQNFAAYFRRLIFHPTGPGQKKNGWRLAHQPFLYFQMSFVSGPGLHRGTLHVQPDPVLQSRDRPQGRALPNHVPHSHADRQIREHRTGPDKPDVPNRGTRGRRR